MCYRTVSQIGCTINAQSETDLNAISYHKLSYEDVYQPKVTLNIYNQIENLLKENTNFCFYISFF